MHVSGIVIVTVVSRLLCDITLPQELQEVRNKSILIQWRPSLVVAFTAIALQF